MWLRDICRVVFRYSRYRQTQCPVDGSPCPRLSDIQHNSRNPLLGIQHRHRKAVAAMKQRDYGAVQLNLDLMEKHISRMAQAWASEGNSP